MNQLSEEHKKLNKKIPYFFFIFFGVLIIIDSIWIYLSFTTYRGVVEEDAYSKGLQYNKNIDGFEQQQKLGFKYNITYLDNVINFNIENYNIPSDEIVLIKIIRKISVGNDIQDNMIKLDNNSYYYNYKFPVKGNWKIVVFFKNSGYQFHRDITI